MNLKKYILIGAIILMITGPLLSYMSTFQGVTLIDDNFTSFDGTKITGTVILPKGHQPTDRAPLIVFMHGYTASKEFFYPLATEFARHGYVCYSFNARGHQTSGNESTLAYLEVQDFQEAITYMLSKNATYRINDTQVGIIGHSHGAMTATIVGSIDPRVNATIPISTGANVSTLLNKFGLSNSLPILATLMNINIDFLDPYELWLRSPIRNVTTDYRNLLLIDGDLDEAFSVQENKEILAKAIWGDDGLADAVVPGQIYVNSSGLRKLVVEHSVEHLMECFMPETFNETITWMDITFYGGLRETVDTTPLILMLFGILLTLLGGLVGFFVFTTYLAKWLYKKVEKPTTIVQDIGLKQKGTQLGLYFGSFAGISALIPLIVFNIPGLQAWIPNLLVDLLGTCFIFIALLSTPLIIAFMWYEKKAFGASLADFGLSKKGMGQSAIIGIVMGFAFVGITSLAVSDFMLKLIPGRIINFLIVFATFLPYMFVMELWGRGFIQMKLSNYGKYKELIGSAIIIGLLQGIGIFITLLVAFQILGFPSSIIINENLPALNLAFVCFIGFTALYIGLSLFAGWIFQRSRNILGTTLFLTIIMSWMLTSWLPVMY
ncbi:MAG TPA: alpha/beta fold hydrolase [Candidatus Deferrimicrobium sp.]|nr:alpha/beta fold hydrolase [Candidatus Deferrimicrobium sp.]